MIKKISELELAVFKDVSTRTIRRWKKEDLKKYDKTIKKYKESELFILRAFLKKHKIELMGNFGIYFSDIDNFSVGVLAEDTNSLITKNHKTNEEVKIIVKNLKTLKEWL